MSDRGILFLFSVLVVLGSLAAAGWLIATGQADSVDGLFLFLTCLVLAFAFGLYLAFLIRREMEVLKSRETATAKAAATAQSKPEPVAR